jgi:hypothetical protein
VHPLIVTVAKLLRVVTMISWGLVWLLVVVLAYTHYTYPETEKSLRPYLLWTAITTTVSYLLGFLLYAKSKAVRANVPRSWADRMFGGRSGYEDYLEKK